MNSGVLSVCTAFLSGEPATRLRSQELQQLIAALLEFMAVCKRAIRVHFRLIGEEDQEFHTQLMNGFQSLTAELSHYIPAILSELWCLFALTFVAGWPGYPHSQVILILCLFLSSFRLSECPYLFFNISSVVFIWCCCRLCNLFYLWNMSLPFAILLFISLIDATVTASLHSIDDVVFICLLYSFLILNGINMHWRRVIDSKKQWTRWISFLQLPELKPTESSIK